MCRIEELQGGYSFVFTVRNLLLSYDDPMRNGYERSFLFPDKTVSSGRIFHFRIFRRLSFFRKNQQEREEKSFRRKEDFFQKFSVLKLSGIRKIKCEEL